MAGQMTIDTPSAMNAIPGITSTRPETGRSIMAWQVSATGHRLPLIYVVSDTAEVNIDSSDAEPQPPAEP